MIAASTIAYSPHLPLCRFALKAGAYGRRLAHPVSIVITATEILMRFCYPNMHEDFMYHSGHLLLNGEQVLPNVKFENTLVETGQTALVDYSISGKFKPRRVL